MFEITAKSNCTLIRLYLSNFYYIKFFLCRIYYFIFTKAGLYKIWKI